MLNYILFQVLLILWNIYNARIDAHRILTSKAIAHGINFAAYAGFTTGLLFFFHVKGVDAVLWAQSAFFVRQLAFDIPLNLRRGLPWYYQSVAEPPRALMDRVERLIFGTGDPSKEVPVGMEIAAVYVGCWSICLIIKIISPW